jgi:acetoin utilization deacetylase AcuC-like enzyme
MKVTFHEAFYEVYTGDPAAAPGRMEAVVSAIQGIAALVTPHPAAMDDIEAVHHMAHIDRVRRHGLYDIAALAAGSAIETARTGLSEPAFALVRPPGHHASASSSWGFCYFNNMAVAMVALKRAGLVHEAFILDFDLHFGDGTVNILGERDWVSILNPEDHDRQRYLQTVESALKTTGADMIGVSAGFDNHRQDWGGLLRTEDYCTMGRWVRKAAERNRGGCFGILEGGYNHEVLGKNVAAFIQGLGGPRQGNIRVRG